MKHLETLELDKASNVLKLLGDKTRLAMVSILNTNDCCVCEFVEIFQMSQPAISQHIRKLKDAGLIKETRKGQWIFYSLNKDSEYYSVIVQLLKHIPDQSMKLKELEKQGLRMICE